MNSLLNSMFAFATKACPNRFLSGLCLLLLLLYPKVDSYSQLVLNEIMSFNSTTIKDQFNEYPDWLEVYNSGSSPVDLGDYWLSDEILVPKKWNLPSIELLSNEYKIYFASGRDINTGVSYWHTIIDIGDEWRYMVPQTDLGHTWKSSLSSTDSWNRGASGFGYSDNDDATIVDQTVCLYLQHAFIIDDTTELTVGALHMDYDDGFIAYLNGIEIARSSGMGGYGDAYAYNDVCPTQREAIMYSGNYPESFDISPYMNQLKQGENILAIEVHNVSINSSDLTAIPILMLGFSSIQGQYETGNGHILTNTVYPHTNFKIASGGESIYLADNSGMIVDSISTHYIPNDYSFGRIPANQDQFGYFTVPTPGAENSPDYAIDYVSDSVDITIIGEKFDPIQSLMVIKPQPDDMIYYTTDGSEPTLSSPVFPGNLQVTSTQVIRARVIRDGQLPGPVTTKTIFTGRQPDLPMVSVSTHPDNLWDHNTGIYVKGPNAEDKNPYFGANFWMDWEKPVNIEIYGEDGNEWMNQSAGTKIYGAWSRANAQKSLAFYARSSYGEGSFSYPLFPCKDINDYESFILRNGGNDFNRSFIRDALTGLLADEMGLDHQGYRPSVVYLNGEYFGIMNMREKINEHFIAENNRVHPGEVNLIEGTGAPVHGSNATYQQLLNFIRTHDLRNSGNYESVKKMMDVDNFIRYWLLQTYIDNRDWPGNNIKFWSTSGPGSKFRWIIYDTDFGYSIWDAYSYTFNTLAFTFSEGGLTWANQPPATELFRALMGNITFRNSFINQLADRMNTVLLPENIISHIDSMKILLEDEVPFHFERWGGSTFNWISDLNRMKLFASQRPGFMTDHVLDRFNISNTNTIIVDVQNREQGSVRVNSIIPGSYPFTGEYFKSIPIELEAIPAPGYIFSHWEGEIDSEEAIIKYGMNAPASFNAVFAHGSGTNTHVVINEINYASSPGRNTEDWIELYNQSNTSVDLSNWRIIDNSSLGMYLIPKNTIIKSKGYMVFSRSIPDFKRFYPENSPVVGELNFGLNAISDGISLYDASFVLQDEVVYGSVLPWPEEANGTGATLELIHPLLDNSLPESWKASTGGQGTPNQMNSQYVVAVDPAEEMIADIELYPTVFNDQTHLLFTTSQVERINISVISLAGKVIDVIVNEDLPPGVHQYSWKPGPNILPGMYFIRINTSTGSDSFKVIFQ